MKPVKLPFFLEKSHPINQLFEARAPGFSFTNAFHPLVPRAGGNRRVGNCWGPWTDRHGDRIQMAQFIPSSSRYGSTNSCIKEWMIKQIHSIDIDLDYNGLMSAAGSWTKPNAAPCCKGPLAELGRAGLGAAFVAGIIGSI